MDNIPNWHDTAGEVEAMLLAAGDYVRASDDLRPRVLEAARLQRRELRARRMIRRAAVAVVLLAAFTASVAHQAKSLDGRSKFDLLAADSQEMHERAAVRAAWLAASVGGWSTLSAILNKNKAKRFGRGINRLLWPRFSEPRRAFSAKLDRLHKPADR